MIKVQFKAETWAMKFISEVVTMSSLEIAELGEQEQGYLQNWIHPQNGQTYKYYALNKRDSLNYHQWWRFEPQPKQAQLMQSASVTS